MIIYNNCSKCGRKIKAVRNDPILILSLQYTKSAICNHCDPTSKWIPVYPVIEGKGKIDDWEYEEIITECGSGLLLKSPSFREIYFPPLAPLNELKASFYALPEHIREKLIEYPLIQKIFKTIT